MDYMFAPGRTGYDRGVRKLYARRANTEVITRRPHPTVSGRNVNLVHIGDYMSHLNDGAGITRPLQKVFIGTHGNDSGWMQIQFGNFDVDGNGRPERNTTYEVLELADTPISSLIYHFKNASRDVNTHVHIRGCMIGQSHATPFLTKLKKALGDVVPVAAPKHFHAWMEFRDAGHSEFFCYQFQIARPTRFTGSSARADLIQAFKDENFSYIGSLGTVHDDWWEQWVPRRINRNGTIRSRVNLSPSIQPRRGNAVTRPSIRLPRSFRSTVQRFRYTVGGVTSDPGSPSAREQSVKATMQGDPKFQAAHDFPYFERYEFDNFNDFFDGFNWRVTYNRRRDLLIANGTRRLYTCVIPITSDPDPNDATKNHLIFNFNPNSNNPNPAIALINEADTDLFSIV